MDALILILCLALTFLLLGILLTGFLRVRNGFRALKSEEEEECVCARRIIVKQEAGEVEFAYFMRPLPTKPVREFVSESEPLREGEVVIRPAERLTFEEKYDRLPKASKTLFERFSEYFCGKPDCGKQSKAGGMTFRYRKTVVARAAIKRDTAVLYFRLSNPELWRMVREEKLKSVRVQPAEIKLSGKEGLELAEQTADLAIEFLKDEEKAKLEKRKEARREAARAKRLEGMQ